MDRGWAQVNLWSLGLFSYFCWQIDFLKCLRWGKFNFFLINNKNSHYFSFIYITCPNRLLIHLSSLSYMCWCCLESCITIYFSRLFLSHDFCKVSQQFWYFCTKLWIVVLSIYGCQSKLINSCTLNFFVINKW